jgi:hypothetical protein
MSAMVEKRDYNGWTNYETWNVNLWLTNDEGSESMLQEILDDFRKDEDDEDSENDINGAARAIKGWVEEMMPDLGPSMFSDLLGAAMSEVDWYEIAQNHMDDREP